VVDAADVEPTHVRGWLADLTESGAASKTISARYQAVRALFLWLVAEGEVEVSPVVKVQRPRVVEPEVRVPTTDDLRAVLATCTDRKSFAQVRDTAVIRLWFDAGLRRTELASLRVEDVNTVSGEVTVLGKGRKRRTVALGVKVQQALARYLRLRARHPHADSAALWLGDRGRGPIDADSLYTMLKRRAAAAGLKLHPHQLRHYFADQWMREGGSDGGLMRAAGWSSRQMLDRYASANAAERSRTERRRLSIGDEV
jgi:site-specific recombinase XerC